MKVRFPGLVEEKMPSGAIRRRVRVEGRPGKRIRIYVAPDNPKFSEHYHAARTGIQLKPETKPENSAISGSVAWLTYKHLADLKADVDAGQASPLTLKKRTGFMKRLREQCGEYAMLIPTTEIVKIRDSMRETPASADSMVEAIRAMYRWAMTRGIVDSNPATGVARIDRGRGGAVPWTESDLRKFRDHHPPGTTAYLCLTIFMFTACRISDAVRLGPGNEFVRDGVRGLRWQPAKAGTPLVEIPMLPALYDATRADSTERETYLVTSRGKPFGSPDALGHHFRRWCRDAGLENRSSHGIRKAAGGLLASAGCTEYQVMAIHGHTNPQTSAIYTRSARRWQMAAEAMDTFRELDW